MPSVPLRALINPRSGGFAAVTALLETAGPNLRILDASGRVLLGESRSENSGGDFRAEIRSEDATLGFVAGPATSAKPVAEFLKYMAERESERRAMASEVLNLYREVHLIEHLSEELAALLNLPSVS